MSKIVTFKREMQQESRATTRKPRDAAVLLFGLSSATTFNIQEYKTIAKLREPGFTAPNIRYDYDRRI